LQGCLLRPAAVLSPTVLLLQCFGHFFFVVVPSLFFLYTKATQSEVEKEYNEGGDAESTHLTHAIHPRRQLHTRSHNDPNNNNSKEKWKGRAKKKDMWLSDGQTRQIRKYKAIQSAKEEEK
jgi:hypothetical protein